MAQLNVIGIDLAKNSWQICKMDKSGKVLSNQAMGPEKAIAMLQNTQPCTIAIEACGGAHFFGRRFIELGHEVKIIPPQYVRAFVIGNHNDKRDAVGICEASKRQDIRFVPVKSKAEQELASLHTMRDFATKQKVALVNHVRGLLFENGFKATQGDKPVMNLASDLVNEDNSGLSEDMIFMLRGLLKEIKDVIAKRDDLSAKLEAIAKGSEDAQRLMDIPGVGPLIATAMLSKIGDPKTFKNGRQFSAFLGVVPGHHHTGGPQKKAIVTRITKRGDKYLRQLLVQGARAYLASRCRSEKHQKEWVVQLKNKKNFNVAAVALANKNARVIWALLAHNDTYKPKKAA